MGNKGTTYKWDATPLQKFNKQKKTYQERKLLYLCHVTTDHIDYWQ